MKKFEIKNREKFIKWFWILFFSPIIFSVAGVLFVAIFTDVPSFKELEDPQNNLATELISEDGVILSTYHIENRSFVTYDELSPNLVNALISTEDVRFRGKDNVAWTT